MSARNGMRDVEKKQGAGKGNWGSLKDMIEENPYPVNEPFNDEYVHKRPYSPEKEAQPKVTVSILHICQFFRFF